MNSPDAVLKWRKEQRLALLARRMAVPPSLHRQWNDAITRRLCQAFPMPRNSAVGFYWPFKGEFDPRFAIRTWRLAGARAALPVVVEKHAPLAFREWWPGVATSPGVFDLPVPQGTSLLVPDALLIPPVGFDHQGFRLGYGGGYFDRTLAAMQPQPIKIAVAFELSRMATIDPQPHDIAMDFVVTELGVYRRGPAGLELIGSVDHSPAWEAVP